MRSGLVCLMAAAAGLAAKAARAEVAVDFKIDLGKENHAISPLIFGSNTGDLTAADGVAFRRSGGNRLTGYNWENNASNAGSDWYHSSDALMGGGEAPGKSMTDFHDGALAEGALSVITLPAAGYVSKDKKGNVEPAETAPSARWAKVVFEKGKPFTQAPDVNDGEVYTDEFAALMVAKYGDASSEKGVKYYEVDNEPGLWSSTHPRIHPAKVTCAELIQRTRDLSIAVKKVDPKVEVFGGVFYGYNDFASLQEAPDWAAAKTAGKYAWYLDYFLDRMKKESDKAGKRLLDVLDLHWYPEATGDHRISDAAAKTAKDREARLQAPRSLWDADYAESSWISKWATPKQPVANPGDPAPGPINLLPRVFESIAEYYPGTKVAVTEYNYGEVDHVTGGLAQADFLGVMARTNVFAAAFWPLGGKPTYAASAFRLFRNYDGKQGRFGSTWASATASDRENASVFASFDPAGDEVHLIVLNKNATETVRGSFTVASPVALTQGKVFGFDGGGAALSEKAAVGAISGNAFTYVLPPWSARHFVIKTAGALPAALRHPFAGALKAAATEAAPAYLPDGRRFPGWQGKAKTVPVLLLFRK
ncbi:MAG TPA: glycoside hydrolase family 44 protein [Fibrobacteria bacterium]|nr:glycoside hydrolase family 44 protein [Fibrobacteria bacterium]